jgi:acetyltransferase-like isoleucine patch superfamily enzyme
MKFNCRNISISTSAKIGKNVRIGDGTVIYDNVTIGDNSVIANDCVLGEPLVGYYTDSDYVNPLLIIGENALIRSHTIIYAGSTIGHDFSTGHRVTIREKSSIGNHCRIGTGSDLQGFLEMGDHCQLHSSVHLCQHSRLGNFVFIYPNVVLANDRLPPTEIVAGPEVEDYVQIGIQSSLIGNIRIGANSLVGAQTTATKDFEPFSFILGSPAYRKSDVRELLDENGAPLYPWKDRFSRGMPWKNMKQD